MATTRKRVVRNVVATPPTLGGGGAAVPPSVPASGRQPEKNESAFMRMLVSRLKSHLYKSTVGWMHDTINPLWNISSRQAQMIYDLARSGNFAQLQYLYNEIENCSPVFSVCVTRRCGAISELDWKVVRSDERLTRGADETLVKEQIECVETAIAKIDNLPEAFEFFALSAFRGFSVASIWRGVDGMPQHLECLDHWNVCLDKPGNAWLWNPGAVSIMNPLVTTAGMTAIPPEDSIAIRRKREIDWPAMKIFLRESIGERDWGRFLETYGLPPVILTMPENTAKEDVDAYVEAAASVFEGRTGVVPYGSDVNFASESRGVNPFTEFIDHQMKLYVLLSTGGTLTSLSEAQGIGSGASDVQMDVWKQIVRADKRIISNAINTQLVRQIIESQKDFKGKPVLAEFSLDVEPPMSAREVVEMASQLSSAGYEMDAEEIARLTGFTVRKKVEGGGMGFNGRQPDGGGSSVVVPHTAFQADDDPAKAANAGGDAPRTSRDASAALARAAMPPVAKTRPEPSMAAAEAADAVTPKAEAIGERLVRSLQRDFKGVADEIAKVLSLPEEKRAGAATELLKRVDELVPDDPAMAEVIAEQMQEAFARQLEKQPEGDAPAANRVIPNAEGKC